MALKGILLLFVILFASTANAAPKTILVNDCGAKGDGTTLDTAAIQKTIDTAAPKKETVSFKPGTYLTGAIFLKSGVTLDVPEGVTLTGSQNIADYPELPTRIAGIEMTWPTAMINIRDAHDVTLTGKGTIDGNGAVWWKVYTDLRAAVRAQGAALGLRLRCQARAAHADPELLQRALRRGNHAQALRLLDGAGALLARRGDRRRHHS